MDHFVGRKRELALLAREFDKPNASLVIAYGRRRIGKSRLLVRRRPVGNEVFSSDACVIRAQSGAVQLEVAAR